MASPDIFSPAGPPQRCFLSAVFGIISHLGYFIHGEYHLQAPNIAQGFLATIAVLYASLLKFSESRIVIYRLFFPQLRHSPGPKLAAVSKLYHVSKLGKYDNFKLLDRWHRQYGDWVRIGPRELSILSPNALKAAIGRGSKCTKPPFYDITKPLISMQTSRDVSVHDKRRRIWENGFSSKGTSTPYLDYLSHSPNADPTLHSYEPRVARYATELLAYLEANAGVPINMSARFIYLSFDIVGELAFGRGCLGYEQGCRSDSTASTPKHLFYHLAKHPDMLAKLREELDPVTKDKPFEYRNITNLPYLNGLFNEVLRFHAPIPSGLQRLVLPEGITVDGKFIPGYTVIRTPTWSLMRSEKVFQRPLEFIPERWTDQPELVKVMDAYQPFSRGTDSCIGKGMALMSIKTTAALLATQMDVGLAPGEDGNDLLNHTEDIFTLSMGILDLVFERRT
ncbi:cytochrome P450 [Lophium mytilinum]|uniref:Cytochrome P450 n=1 Tax=Lophium mytilinum TaxID=390894 RepID=A0A6A6QAL8_9PEZI|nr:cytochrome P450 [Lophium mytilinum]